jgi:hypothetical protein
MPPRQVEECITAHKAAANEVTKPHAANFDCVNASYAESLPQSMKEEICSVDEMI